MSVLMTLRVPVERAAFEQATKDHNEMFMSIAADAKTRGAIHHAFYVDGDDVVVVDEWDSAESFQSFFADHEGDIGQLMQAAGAGQPGQPAFYEKLAVGDDY